MCLCGTIIFIFAAMLSNAQSKYIRSLSQQKYRKQYTVFIAEGDKIAREWLSSDAGVQMIVATRAWLEKNKQLIDSHRSAEVCSVTEQELEKVSSLQTPNQVLLVVAAPDTPKSLPTKGWSIATQQIQDPGNMGTIIRIADWFGIEHVIASPDSVDFYNPKVVQAAMGGHLRVQLHTADLQQYLHSTALPVLAATIDGNSLYSIENPGEGIILIGNESKGLPVELLEHATHRVTIPKKGGAESLNAAVSAGILAAFFAGR